MDGRVWDRFLSDRDRARASAQPAIRKGAGRRPALLLVDLYRWVFGDRPQPLLEAIKTWPGSCGLSAWEALPHIQRLLAVARAQHIPIFHITGMGGVSGWRDVRSSPGAASDPTLEGRLGQRYEIVDEVAPIPGEVVLTKTAPSAFWGTPLAGLLVGARVDTVIVAGESTSGCVRATVVDAKSYRFKVLVPEECVFDRDEAPHAINLFDIDQKYADVLPLSEVVGYLQALESGAAAQ
jgi:maleamate amidohydrolase